jgi:hypothetical protein
MLGPIDLEAKALDVAALFPGDAVYLEKATAAEGSMPGSPDTVYVERAALTDGRNAKLVAAIGLDGKRVTRIEIFAPGLVTPGGVKVGMALAAVAAAVPKATCTWGGGLRGMLCSDPTAPGFTYQFDVADWSTSDAAALITAGPKDAELNWIIWDAPAAGGPSVAARPPARKGP